MGRSSCCCKEQASCSCPSAPHPLTLPSLPSRPAAAAQRRGGDCARGAGPSGWPGPLFPGRWLHRPGGPGCVGHLRRTSKCDRQLLVACALAAMCWPGRRFSLCQHRNDHRAAEEQPYLTVLFLSCFHPWTQAPASSQALSRMWRRACAPTRLPSSASELRLGVAITSCMPVGAGVGRTSHPPSSAILRVAMLAWPHATALLQAGWAQAVCNHAGL